MTKELAGQVAQGASAEAPAQVNTDIESVRRDFEERFKGLQRVIAEKDQALEARNQELFQLKTASLSPDERAQLEVTRIKEENDRLAKELELVKLGQAYGEELPIFQQLLNAESAEDQLKVLRALRGVQAGNSQPTAPGPDVDVPDINQTNPMRSDVGGNANGMSGDIAERILSSFKGALRPK
jgi:hypothetical protein